MGGQRASFEKANEQTHLFAQIETVEAVKNVEAICDTEGLSGILVGPGDLSSSFGCTGDFSDPELIHHVSKCIAAARNAGKNAGIVAGPGPLLDAALSMGCNLAFIGSDTSCLAGAWTELLKTVRPVHKSVPTPTIR